jgi:hypothetical protein
MQCLISALAYQQRAQVQPQKQTTLFVGSILGGITDTTLLNNVEVPALEDGCANKKLLVRFLFPLFLFLVIIY